MLSNREQTINELKKDILALQTRRKYNDAIDMAYNAWLENKDDENLCILVIGECFWLLADKGYCDSNPSQQDIGYQDIDWGLEGQMMEAVRYGHRAFDTSATFNLLLGLFWASMFLVFAGALEDVDMSTPFYDYGKELLLKAHRLAPDSALCAIFAGLYSEKPIDAETKKKAYAEVDALDLQENRADCEIRYIMGYTIR